MHEDDAELIKAGTQGLIEGGMKPFSDLIRALFEPAAEEAGSMLQEHVRCYRLVRQTRLFSRTKKAFEKLGAKPKQVPLKLLMPIIENASVEDDDLQDVWANLLANAGSLDGAGKVHPSFTGILKDFTPQDGKFIDALYGAASKIAKLRHGNLSAANVTFDLKVARAVYAPIGHIMNLKLSLDLFERHGLIRTKYGLTGTERVIGSAYSFTRLGTSFIEACRLPKHRR